MAISKYNTEQFSQVSNNQLVGVTFVYRSTIKSGKNAGKVVETAVHFGGQGYVPEDKTEMSLFRVWKQVLTVFWNARYNCAVLQEDNSGIASKLRSTTPTEIIVRLAGGSEAFRWIAEDSAYSRVGIVPGSRELKMKRNDFKKHIHKAAVASFNALKGKISFKCKDDSEEAPVEAPAENAEAAA